MNNTIGDTIRNLRMQKGLTQKQLAKLLFLDRTTITNWELGKRVPNLDALTLISDFFHVDLSLFFNGDPHAKLANVIMVDDEKIILKGGISILESVMPYASVTGFTKASEALAFTKNHPVSLAFLDIKIGKLNGLELIHSLQSIQPEINIVFLTAYREYSLDAWSTGACGFLLKPLTSDAVAKQLTKLRYPFPGGDALC